MGITITPISQEEFVSHAWRKGRPLMAESQAAVDLEQGTGIKFPCRWSHRENGGCMGAAAIRAATKRSGQTTSFRCVGGNLYVWRSM